MPTWWSTRRYGLFVHATIATVPAWAPIGHYSDWYWSHLGEDLPDALLQPRPMVEVLAHHRERWGHIDHYDDFLELLTFDNFDAEEWARLAVDAGMGYTVLVSKHHDGLCWWDAPGTDRTVLDRGPQRNVLAEFAAACERNELIFGTYYSLLDWGDDRYPTDDYIENVLHPHITDLVERYGSSVLWGDGHWGHGPDHWRTKELLDKMREIDPELVINDRWWASNDDVPVGGAPLVRTFEYDPPDDITPGPWELCRGIGHSFGHNRNERNEHHLSGFDIVALLTEVVAKGGNLLLNVGPAADGSIPEMQAAPLRDAGTWIRRHNDLISGSTPWTLWGDDNVRYLVVDDVLHAVDLSGAGDFEAIDRKEWRTLGVQRVDADGTTSMRFSHDETGLHLELPTPNNWRRSLNPANDQTDSAAAIDVAVYRIELAEADKPSELFAPIVAEPIDLAPLLTGASPGEIVQLGDGTYVGPATVPAGVILRGLGPSRTILDGGGAAALTLGRSSRVEHLTIGGAAERVAWFEAPAVLIEGQFASVLGCEVAGHIIVAGDDALIRATSMVGLVTREADRLTISRCQLRGNRWDLGVHLVGGTDHEVDSCEFANHVGAIRAIDTVGTVIRGNNIESRWWGIHLERTERAHVHGNQIHDTMRAVNVDGGTSALIDGNAVTNGDSGCVVENGAADCRVSGNHWERCRIGLLAWDTPGLHHQANHAHALHEPDAEVTIGP